MIKSTGGAAGFSAQQIEDMADALEKVSTIDGDVIQSGANVLMTFTSIGQDVFPRATRAAVDLSEAMGQDLQSSVVQIGKALNDPIAGLGSLTRVGIQFTDQQKDQIRVMAEAGNIAAAQGIILEELERQFGGSAAAAQEAGGQTEIYKDRMAELSDELGEKMLPITEKLTELKLKLVDAFVTKVIPVLAELYEKHWPGIQQAMADVAKVVRDDFWPAFEAGFETIAPAVEEFVNFLLTNREALVATIVAVTVALFVMGGPVLQLTILIAGLIAAIGALKKAYEELQSIVGDVEVGGQNVGRGGLGDLLENIPVIGKFYRASGGPVSGGSPYIVGERGPELFVPGGSGSIVPNHALGGMGGATYIFNIQGSVIAERQLLSLVRDDFNGGGFEGSLA